MSLSDRSILPSFAGQRADPPDPPLLQLQRDPRRRRLVRARAEDDDFAIARDRFERTLEI